MIVQYIIPSFYPAVIYGGPIFSSYHTCTELAKLGNVSIRVSTTNTNMHSKLDVECNRFLPLNGFEVKYYNETVVDKFSLSLCLMVWKDIKNSDVVHIQSIFNTPTPISLFYASFYNKKTVLSPRGSLGEWCLNNGSKFKKLWLRFFIKPFLKNVIWHATSEQEKNEIKNIFPNAKVEVIPNGIDYLNFQNYNSLSRSDYLFKYLGIKCDVDKIIVSMGRIEKKKGFDILLNSFSNVLKIYPNAKLLIAGSDQGELSNLLDLSKTLKITESVFFIGNISGQDKIDFLSNADLFVLPSHNENFGNVYIESLASGTPIVASKNTPWAEVEKTHCGKCVDNNINDTTQAIFDLLKADMSLLRKNSKQYAKNFDWSIIAKNFEVVYRRNK